MAGSAPPLERLLRASTTAPEAFTDRYVFPNGELVTMGRIVDHLDDSGLEVHHAENLRLHYARTMAAWSQNLVAQWDDAMRLVGEQTAQVWGLFMAAARLGFEVESMHLSQVLASKPLASGATVMPLRSRW